MQTLIILSSSAPEIKWNAVRLGNFLLDGGDEVTIFLNGPAVDLFQGDSDQFPIAEQAKLFTLSEGVLAGCGKCMALHGVEATDRLRLGNMKMLAEQVRLADKILSF